MVREMKKIRQSRYFAYIAMVIIDAIILALSFGLALWVRFDFRLANIPGDCAAMWRQSILLTVPISLIVFAATKLYHFIWRSVGLRDVLNMVLGILLAFAVSSLALLLCGVRLPTSVSFISLILELILLIGLRVALRVYGDLKALLHRAKSQERILLIGGGAAGQIVLREFATSDKSDGTICAIIDDNPTKKGKKLEGVRIYGGREKIAECVREKNITQILLAIPSLSPKEKKEILRLCSDTGVNTKTVPGIYQIVGEQKLTQNIKDVSIEDLLGREPIRLELHAMHEELSGTVMVTGGGGSIGSELCRQAAHYHPKQLVIVDIYENNAYEIQQELFRKYGAALNLSVEIASVRDAAKMDALFERYRPDIVFHAAAHKHVPLMENSPAEAIKNNIFGTYHVANAAERYGVRKFVMISTDKAVNPTNVMGATKRFCEMIMQSRKESKTEFCAVRFGNVLGSNGSVVPLFKKQIAEGGPVTITDKRITRFFMTIPEAVQLVLEAGSMARQGQIFVLDMGEPVHILDLAENLIRLSGLRPYQDIDIVETGLRPGEKLYEELLMESNRLLSTKNKKIFVEQQESIDPQELNGKLNLLREALSSKADNAALTELLKTMIPTYHSPEEVNGEREREGYGTGS